MADPYADLGGEDEESAYRDLGATLEARQDWGDAANSGASVVQEPPCPESIAPEPYGPPENPNPIGSAHAFLQAFGQGGHKQGMDEYAGALVAGAVGSPETRGEIYRRARDRVRADLAAGQEQHPYLSMAGNMLGDMGSDFVASRVFGIPVGSALYQVGMGALSGFLGSDADLTQPTPESLMQAGEETTLGGAAAYAIPMVGRYAGRQIAPYLSRGAGAVADWWGGTAASDWLENLARERALKAAGWIQKDFPKKGEAPERLERLLNQGQTLLDEPGVIGPFSSKAAIRDRLEPLVQREGRRIGSHLDTADSVGLSADAPWHGGSADDVPIGGYDPYAFASGARRTIETPAIRNPNLTPQGNDVKTWLDRFVQSANEQAAEGAPMTFRDANRIKTGLQDRVFGPNGDVPASRAVRDELQHEMTQDIDRQIAPYLGPDALDDFKDARWKFGAFKAGLKHSVEGANRDVGNNGLGLKDWQAAQTFAQAAENTPGLGWAAPIVAVGSKLARGRGDSFAARTADSLAQAQWLDTLASTQPEVIGQWGQYLSAAAARSPEALGQMHNNLSETEPDYQRRMRLLGGQQE